MLKQPNQTENELTQDQEQKIDYTKYDPYYEFDDKILGPAAKEVENIKNQIENLVNDLTDLSRRSMFNPDGNQKPIEDIPLKRLAEKGVLPGRLGGKTTRKRDKIDEDYARYWRESNEKIPVAPLTLKEKELLQQTLTKDALSEADFAIMAIRQKLRSTNPTGPFQDDRRELSPSYF